MVNEPLCLIIILILKPAETINDADATVASAVKSCLHEISRAVDLIADRVRLGGRVIYVGAGTSGRYVISHLTGSSISSHLVVLFIRLGVLDASEM